MKYYLAALSAVVLFVSCVHEEAQAPLPDSVVQADVESVLFVPGKANVYFSEEMTELVEGSLESGSYRTKANYLNAVLEELGVIKMERLFPHGGKFEPRTRAAGLHRWYQITYSDVVPRTKAQVNIGSIPGVELVEPVRKSYLKDFNDMSMELWGLSNRLHPGVDINVKPVWDNYTVGDPKVIVSVMDGGVDLTHEDLADNCLSSGHYNSTDGSTNIVPNDHGTHVAGTIAAVSNNGKGIAGIAGGNSAKGKKGVSIMSSQIADQSGAFSNPEVAFYMAANNGAVISQNSWGYVLDVDHNGIFTPEEWENFRRPLSSSLVQAINYFIKFAGCDENGKQLPGSPMKGGIVFFAAGNESIDYDPICCNTDVIAVGAIDNTGARADFSNYGEWVDLCAPGVAIKSTVPGSYGTKQGTSMACPHVSGVAALVVSHFGGPGFTNEDLKEKLLEGANSTVVPESYKIGKLVDAYGAIVYGNDKAPAPVTDLNVSGIGNSIDLEWTVPTDEDGVAAYGYMVLYGQNITDVEEASATNYSKVNYDVCIPGLQGGEKAQFTVKGLDFESEYHVKVIAYSYGRNFADPTPVMTVSTTENHAPVVTSSVENEVVLLPSETVNVDITLSDPDRHEFTYTFDGGSAAATLNNRPDGSSRLTIKGSDAEMGTYKASITVTDSYSLTTKWDIQYTIKENSAPEKVKDIEDILLAAKGRESIIDMSEYVVDPDGEQLKYEAVVSNTKVLHFNAKYDKVTLTSLSYGTTDVTLVAKDARGEAVTFEFTVVVKDPSKPVSVYPNPVKDYVNVGTLDVADTRITISGSAGKVVYDDTVKAGALEPARIDMRDFAPGVYKMTVKFSGKEYSETVVKL